MLIYVDDMLIVGWDNFKIEKLKKKLSKSFDKNLRSTRQILGLRISHDRKVRHLWVSHESYIKKVLESFQYASGQAVGSPLASHFKLSSRQCPSTEKESDEMKVDLHASAIRNLIVQGNRNCKSMLYSLLQNLSI